MDPSLRHEPVLDGSEEPYKFIVRAEGIPSRGSAGSVLAITGHVCRHCGCLYDPVVEAICATRWFRAEERRRHV